jgi:hypothetical protein
MQPDHEAVLRAEEPGPFDLHGTTFGCSSTFSDAKQARSFGHILENLRDLWQHLESLSLAHFSAAMGT